MRNLVAICRVQDGKYKVIWLPGATQDEALHECRTYSKAVCMVRMRTKYGIRVLKREQLGLTCDQGWISWALTFS